MMNDFKEKFKSLYERIKKVKHIEIYLAVGLAVIVAFAYFGFVKTKDEKKTENLKIDNVNSNFYFWRIYRLHRE